MTDNTDFNFEWSSKPITQVTPTPIIVEDLSFESLYANMLKTRVAGKSFSLFLGTSEVAVFEIENITSIDLIGSNIIIYFSNRISTVLKFIDNSESVFAEANIEIMLNGGTVS